MRIPQITTMMETTTTEKPAPNGALPGVKPLNPVDPDVATSDIEKVLDFMMWGTGVAAVFAIVLIGIKIIVSRGGSNPEGAAKALGGLPWVAGALILALSSLTLVNLFF